MQIVSHSLELGTAQNNKNGNLELLEVFQ